MEGRESWCRIKEVKDGSRCYSLCRIMYHFSSRAQGVRPHLNGNVTSNSVCLHTWEKLPLLKNSVIQRGGRAIWLYPTGHTEETEKQEEGNRREINRK